MKHLLKLLVLFILVMLIFTTSTSCGYNPPEGYTEKHHTRDEILEFARSIDPNATVSETYTDTQIDDWNRNFREWDAVINGIECHVSSVGDMVFDLTGEFPKQYYVIDTDYDYLLLQKIISEKQPDWKMHYTDISGRYNWNHILSVDTSYMEKRELSADELEAVYLDAYEIYQEYNSYPIRKTAHFNVAAPAVYVAGESRYIKITSNSIYNFSDEGKAEFFKDYVEDWDLMESGLPIKE